MRPTRRLWAVAGLGSLLAVLAVVLARPLALVGAVLLGVWILSRQYAFSRATAALVDDLSVTQKPAQEWLHTDGMTPVTLAATLAKPSRLTCSVHGGLPVAADTDRPEVTLEPGTTAADETVTVRWPVAGRHTFAKATLTVTDGLFTGRLPVGSTPTVTVEPRGPRNVHVGQGGDRLVTAYGEHDAGRRGSGIDPAELREYRPGDVLEQIDWNATARLGKPYVREFESQTDNITLLVVDHRGTLSMGPPGETKLAYLRQVALAVTDSARRLGDPLGFLAVGDDGVTRTLDPTTAADRYATVRKALFDLEPTAPARVDASTLASVAGAAGQVPETKATIPESVVLTRNAPQTVDDVQQSLVALGTDDAFERVVRPFFEDHQQYQYQTRRDSDPLYSGLVRALAPERGEVFVVLCSDDSSPTELRETVRLARRQGGRVLVLLAPTVLYERGGLSDLERAYERYVDFEELRLDLSRVDGVIALEVGPRDRLSTVLAAGRNRRRAGGGRE